MNKDNYKKIIGSVILFIVLIIITFYVILKDQDIDELKKIILSTNILYLLPSFMCMFIYILCEGINIKILLKEFGIRKSLLTTLKYSMVGYFFSSITPSSSGGQPMQIYYMKKDRINISTSTLILLITLCGYLIVSLFFSTIGFITNYSFVMNNSSKIKYVFIIGFSLNIIALFALLFIIFSKKISNLVKNILGKIYKLLRFENCEERMQKIDDGFTSYQEGATFIRKKRIVFFKVILVTLVQLLSLYSISYFVYKAFNLSGYNYIDCLMLQAFLIGSISSLPLPGGVGISEGGFTLLFLKLFTRKLIKSAMIIYRFASFYLYVLISGLIVSFNVIFKKKVS